MPARDALLVYRIPPRLDVIAPALDAFGKETTALGHEGLPRERSVEIAAQPSRSALHPAP
jgi:hypothetical protein